MGREEKLPKRTIPVISKSTTVPKADCIQILSLETCQNPGLFLLPTSFHTLCPMVPCLSPPAIHILVSCFLAN